MNFDELLNNAKTKVRPPLPPGRKREQLEAIVNSVRVGHCCRVLGPRGRAKSQLMQRAAALLQADGTHYTAYQSLRDVPLLSGRHYFWHIYEEKMPPLVNEADFFAGLYSAIAPQLTPRLPVRPPYPKSAFEFQSELLRRVQQSDRNLAVFIDDLEMAPPNLVAALLGVLQAVYMTVVDHVGPRFQAVVCGSLSFSQLTLESASHFESISELVLIGDLDEAERRELVDSLYQKADLTLSEMAAPALLAQTGGDPHLIERVTAVCIARTQETGITHITPARIDETIEQFLQEPPDETIVETLRQVQSEPNLLSCTLQLLEKGETPSAALPITTNETPNPLDLCGVFEKNGDSYRIKCPLWRQLLRLHLDDTQIGGLYAVAGYWSDAIHYLGRAVRQGDIQIRTELFTVIVNAIHVSQDRQQAHRYLAEGLRAAYPDTTLCLYQYTETALKVVECSDSNRPQQDIPLHELNRPEVEALRGPDYSLSSDERDTYLLIPLRAGGVRTRPLGLVSLGGLISVYSPYQQRKEVLEFVGFLHQAARAILRAALHEEDERKHQMQEKVSAMSKEISIELTLGELYSAILSNVKRAIPLAHNACIVELDEMSRKLHIAPSSYEHYGADGWFPDEPYEVGINGRSGIAGRVMRNGRSALIHNVKDDADYIPAIATTQSQLCVPIRRGANLHTALVVESDEPNAFTNGDLRLLEMLADYVKIAIQNAIEFEAARERQLREQTAMLATGFIHDINSAVASIPDLVDEVSRKLISGRDVTGPLSDLESSARDTMRISRRLRDLVVTGQEEKRFIDVEELIRNAILISRKQEPPYVKTLYSMDGLQVKVKADAIWLELMLKNLIVNAYDAVPPDREGLVTITTEVEPEHVLIRVQDNGRGIPSHVLPSIFELGYTTKTQHRMHGIGLYHSQQIVQAHDGELQVEKSEIDVGTTFLVKLHRAHSEEVEEGGPWR